MIKNGEWCGGFWAISRPYKKHCAIGVLSSLLLTSMLLVPSRVTGILIDDVLKPGNLSASDVAFKRFYFLVGALALSFVLREFFSWLRFRYMSIMGEYVATDLRRDLYTHMQKLGLDFYAAKSSGSLVSRITSDTDRLWDFIAFGIVEVFVSSLMLLGIGAVLLSMDWRLGLVMLIPIPFFTLLDLLAQSENAKTFSENLAEMVEDEWLGGRLSCGDSCGQGLSPRIR